MTGPDSFCFLGQARSLSIHGWDDKALDKLWRYNLHYFDDLNAIGAEERTSWHRAVLEGWVAENPPPQGSAWEPYPTSLRIVNWIKWALSGNNLPEQCVQSLAVQIRWLCTRLEFHLLGNHLFANAKALVFAGLFFEGAEADAWLQKGLSILDKEMPEQILKDGGHFERSTMYHALALEDMLDLCNLFATYSPIVESEQGKLDKWRATVERMRHWMSAMCHPDGEISFFNDAAFDIAPAPAELERYACDLGFGIQTARLSGLENLDKSGYLRIAHGPLTAFLDVAPVGPDYLPGHAHADTLSFEASIDGHRVFVNSGTSCYGEGQERQRQRGTAAHNTVVIDGENSSEVWAGFRVARRAYPFISYIRSDDDCCVVEASHSGYRRLQGKNLHCRRWTLSSNVLQLEDRIHGPCNSAEARFHLHPDVKVELRQGGAQLATPSGRRIDFAVDEGDVFLEAASWHPRFGESLETTCLGVRFCSPTIKTRITW